MNQDKFINKKCIVIPPRGPMIHILWQNQKKYVGDVTDGISIPWLDEYNYALAIICNDLSAQDEYNVLASKIAKSELHGNCIIVDDNKDLDRDDIVNICKLNKQFQRYDNGVFKSIEDSTKAQLRMRNFLEEMNKRKR